MSCGRKGHCGSAKSLKAFFPFLSFIFSFFFFFKKSLKIIMNSYIRLKTHLIGHHANISNRFFPVDNFKLSTSHNRALTISKSAAHVGLNAVHGSKHLLNTWWHCSFPAVLCSRYVLIFQITRQYNFYPLFLRNFSCRFSI